MPVQGGHQCSVLPWISVYRRHWSVNAMLDASWTAVLTDPVRLSVLRCLCRLRIATIAELTDLCHTSDPTVRRHLEALETLGLVHEQRAEADGVTPGRPARRFMLDPDAATRLCALFDLISVPLVPTPQPAQPPPLGR
jgi:DNA-binding transcriptional ArsR family regulator